MAKKVSEERKKDFIDKLASMTDEEIFEYIKKNGKNNANDRLFVFQWDNLNPKKKTVNNK
jgi:hypothetical protein|nr:MAG TPA: RPAP1-like protein [Caudoviricetes sp.]